MRTDISVFELTVARVKLEHRVRGFDTLIEPVQMLILLEAVLFGNYPKCESMTETRELARKTVQNLVDDTTAWGYEK